MLEKLVRQTSETSVLSASKPSKGYKADKKADKRSEADISCQPNVSQNVSPETLIQQDIQLSADKSDKADKKKNHYSKTQNSDDNNPKRTTENPDSGDCSISDRELLDDYVELDIQEICLEDEDDG